MNTPHIDQTGPSWQQLSKQALSEQLRVMREHPDGTVLVEPAGVHFIVVLKEENLLRLLLVEQSDPTSGVTQSELDLDRPGWLEPYTQAMVLGLLWQPQPEKIYVAGVGGGRIPQVLHCAIPNLHIDAVDLDPDVIQIATRYFALSQGEGLTLTVADARTFLAQQSGTRYDLIIVDVFLDNGYTPYRMATIEFFQLCRARLPTDGALTINLLTTDPYLNDKLHTVQSIFPYVYTCEVPEENLIAIAANRPVPHNYVAIARRVEEWYELDFSLSEMAQSMEAMAVDDKHASQRSALRFHDVAPPDDYYAALPNFNSPFSRVRPELPCPCGSGRPFAECHAVQGTPI